MHREEFDPAMGPLQFDSQEKADALMNIADNSLLELSALLDQRLALVGTLATSLEASQLALIRNDAEAIARGAAHQAELCYQWSRLEDRLRTEAARGVAAPSARSSDGERSSSCDAEHSSDSEHSVHLEAEWRELCKRIRYLTRVHWSLLRHLQRSLGILKRVVDSCEPTYTPSPCFVEPRVPVGAGE